VRTKLLPRFSWSASPEAVGQVAPSVQEDVAGNGEVVTVAGSSHEAVGETPNVPVALVASRIEAELIVGLLRNNGVNAVVSADDAGGQEPQLQTQGVRVLVPPSEEAAARQLIAAAQEDST
jgi:predicted Fe-Mo cluster-binding NifX family protein